MLSRATRSTIWDVSLLNVPWSSLLVPMSALLSWVLTLTTTQVLSCTFSLSQFSASGRCRRPRVICTVCDAATHALLSYSMTVGPCFQPIMSRIPLLAITSHLSVWLTAFISDSAVEVDTLPWSVLHQQKREPAR